MQEGSLDGSIFFLSSIRAFVRQESSLSVNDKKQIKDINTSLLREIPVFPAVVEAIHSTIMYPSIPKPLIPPPPGQTPGHLTFLKNFGQIPRYIASLDRQMPHPLELQRGSNPPPSGHVTHEINEYKQNRLPLETNSAKFSATTNFLFSLSSLKT